MLLNKSAHLDALISFERGCDHAVPALPPPPAVQQWYAPCWMRSAHWPADNPHQYHQSPGDSNKPAVHSPTKRAAPSSLSGPSWNRLWANWWGWAGYVAWYLPPVWDPLFWSSFISKVCSNQVGSPSSLLSWMCVQLRVCVCVYWCMESCLGASWHVDTSIYSGCTVTQQINNWYLCRVDA